MRRPTLFRALLGICLLLAAAGSAHAALNRWSSGGPVAGGQILALAYDPFDPAIAYAGTLGGAFRSEDHGETWTIASSGLTDAAVIAFAADPETPGTVYALTGEGIQKSLDRGLSWQPPSLTGGAQALALDPSDPRTLYTSKQGTIQKSTNGGASWLPRQNIGAYVGFIEVDPLDSTVVYAGSDLGLYRSVDGGASWSEAGQIGANLLFALEIDPANSQVLYAATSDGIFKSADRGSSWARSGLAGRFVPAIAADPSSPSTLLAVADGIYRSTDAGASWTLIERRFVPYQTIAIAPSPSSTYLVGSVDGIFRSTDQGASWFPSSTGITASNVGDLAVDPHRPGVLFAAVQGNLYKSGDAGASWALVPVISQVHSVAFDPQTPARIYAVTGNGVWRSQDAGGTWFRINASENGGLLAIDPENPLTMYLADFSEGIRKSVDGGLNWSLATPEAELSPLALLVAPGGVLYTGGFDAGVFRSADGGTTWTDIGGGLPSPELNTLAVDPRNANVVYAAVTNDGIYKSTDAGASWSPSGAGFPFPNVDAIAVDPSDSSRLYAFNSLVGVFRSTNGGLSWHRFDEGALPGLRIHEIAIDPVNPYLLYAASYGAGVQARADLPPVPSSLRLQSGRFLVRMSWATAPGVAGRGHTQALTADTGYAWFFQESNVEVLLKVLDGCGLNGRFWVFAAGLTNVRTDIIVGDLETGAIKIYHNPPGQPFQPIQDVNALACEGAVALAPAKMTSAASKTVLLDGGRFRVTAEFAISPIAAHHPAQGALLTDDAAYLWFFNQDNVEVLLKVVDGCPVNGRVWIFAAGLTNLEVRITVEDTRTGTKKVYVNPAGRAFQPIFDTTEFGGCD